MGDVKGPRILLVLTCSQEHKNGRVAMQRFYT